MRILLLICTNLVLTVYYDATFAFHAQTQEILLNGCGHCPLAASITLTLKMAYQDHMTSLQSVSW